MEKLTIISLKYPVVEGRGSGIMYACDKKTGTVIGSIPLYLATHLNSNSANEHNVFIRFSNEEWPMIKIPDDIVIYFCTLTNPDEKLYFTGPINFIEEDD